MSWLSKKLSKSRSRGTGIFSWGSSPIAQAITSNIPVIGGAIQSGLETLSESSDIAQANYEREQSGKSPTSLLSKSLHIR